MPSHFCAWSPNSRVDLNRKRYCCRWPRPPSLNYHSATPSTASQLTPNNDLPIVIMEKNECDQQHRFTPIFWPVTKNVSKTATCKRIRRRDAGVCCQLMLIIIRVSTSITRFTENSNKNKRTEKNDGNPSCRCEWFINFAPLRWDRTVVRHPQNLSSFYSSLNSKAVNCLLSIIRYNS